MHFIKILYNAINDMSNHLRVIVTLRAEFYDRPLLYPEFGELLHTHMETVMPLSMDELERAIAGLAERVKLTLEPGLVAAIRRMSQTSRGVCRCYSML